MNKKICYIRKSTDKQSYDRQLEIFKEKSYIDGVNCKYMIETYTGTSLKRPVFDEMLKELQENDYIIVESLTRFSRGGLYKTIEIIKELVEKKKYSIIFLKENITLQGGENMDSITKMYLGILSILAEFERDQLSERTKEGLKAVKMKGKHIGRIATHDISKKNFIYTLKLQVIDNKGLRESCKIAKFPLTTYQRQYKQYMTETRQNNKNMLYLALTKGVA